MAVKTHSSARRTLPCSARMLATLSSTTVNTLSRISAMSHWSKRLPARVSASKMTM
jgi:hypothetical protein